MVGTSPPPPADGDDSMILGIVPKLGWPRPGPGSSRSQIFSFGIRASGKDYGFVVEIEPQKLARSGLDAAQIAGQARDYAIEVMRSREHAPEQINATEPRQIKWGADPAQFPYCQYFGFGPNGGSVIYLNRPPAGETDHIAEGAFAAESPVDDVD